MKTVLRHLPAKLSRFWAILGDPLADRNPEPWDNARMLRSLVSHFRGEPICVGCEEHPVVSDYLCQYCLAKLADFLAERDKDSQSSVKFRRDG
jgi:hypothetical protein